MKVRFLASCGRVTWTSIRLQQTRGKGCRSPSTTDDSMKTLVPGSSLIDYLATGNLRPLIGVVSISFRFQGWRSFLAQPLANGWHSFGMRVRG